MSPCKIWYRFVALLTHSFRMQWHTVHTTHSVASTAPLTSTVKSSLFAHVHFSPLLLVARYINNTQTVLSIWTMVVLSPDRLRICLAIIITYLALHILWYPLPYSKNVHKFWKMYKILKTNYMFFIFTIKSIYRYFIICYLYIYYLLA